MDTLGLELVPAPAGRSKASTGFWYLPRTAVSCLSVCSLIQSPWQHIRLVTGLLGSEDSIDEVM